MFRLLCVALADYVFVSLTAIAHIHHTAPLDRLWRMCVD